MTFERAKVFFISCGILAMSGLPVLAASVQWQVQQPFRYLRFASDHLIHEWALQELQRENETAWKNAPASYVERKLNDPRWWKSAPPGSAQTYLDRLATLRQQEKRPLTVHDPRLGWGALLRSTAEGGITGTCWSAATQSYQSCVSEPSQTSGDFGYLDPPHHIVKAWVLNDDGGSATGDCVFRTDAEIMFSGTEESALNGSLFKRAEKRRITQPCNEPVYLRVPSKRETVLTVELSGAAAEPPLEEPIEVVDFLVLGMGDSFASGEGNPEMPAELHTANFLKPYTSDDSNGTQHEARGLARRKTPDAAARWTDRRCHRSVYSNQTRAALHLALHGKRHHAITYVSFACSGAEVTDGLLWGQNGRECVTGGARLYDPQFSAAVDALSLRKDPPGERYWHEDQAGYGLVQGDPYRKEFIESMNFYGPGQFRKVRDFCSHWHPRSRSRFARLRRAAVKRTIDLVFLSIGGNDMGFSPLIANRVLRNKLLPTLFLKLFGGDLKPKEAIDRLKFLDSRFDLVNKAFDEKLEMSMSDSSVVSRLDNREIENSKRIVYMTYPSPAHDENGEICRPGRKTMNVSELFQVTPEGPISEAQEAFDALERTIAQHATTHGWTIVDGHKQDMKPHGFCATDSSPRDESGTGTAEIRDIPSRERGSDWLAMSHRNGSGDPSAFDPTSDFHPYEARQRWFRTFNDDFLIMQYARKKYKDPAAAEAKTSATDLATRSIGGPFHPTAQGHARMADHLYCAAAKLLFAADCDPSRAPAPE